MFIISVNYVKPLEEVETLLSQHIEWLKKYYEAGIFIASGRQVPRTGGIILAKSIERVKLDEILKQDPFNNVAEYQVTEFAPSMSIDSLAELKSL